MDTVVKSVIRRSPKELLQGGAQLVAAAVVMLIVYYVSLYASNSDELVTLEAVPLQRQSVMVLEPTINTMNGTPLAFVTTDDARRYNAVDPYVSLPPSLNSRGGAQFTYTFWLSLSKDYGPMERTLFLRGDTTRAGFKNANKTAIAFPASMCPMVRVKATATDVTIYAHFNSLNEYNNVAKFEVRSGSIFDMTMPHLVTISVHEGGSYGEINGTTCKIFVDQMVEQRTFQGQTLKENSGKLHILPTFAAAPADATGYPTEYSGSSSASMWSLCYHNYALDVDDVHALLSRAKKQVPYVPATNRRDMVGQMLTLQQLVG